MTNKYRDAQHIGMWLYQGTPQRPEQMSSKEGNKCKTLEIDKNKKIKSGIAFQGGDEYLSWLRSRNNMIIIQNKCKI